MSIFSATLENVESHYIDNQTMCISIPRWNLWFELKEHQIAPYIEKIPPKGVSFSDFICIFAMSFRVLFVF